MALADFMRLAVLWVRGGFYADYDARLCAGRDLHGLLAGYSFVAFRQPDGHVNNAVLYARAPRCGAVRALLEEATARILAFAGPRHHAEGRSVDISDVLWLTGPVCARACAHACVFVCVFCTLGAYARHGPAAPLLGGRAYVRPRGPDGAGAARARALATHADAPPPPQVRILDDASIVCYSPLEAWPAGAAPYVHHTYASLVEHAGAGEGGAGAAGGYFSGYADAGGAGYAGAATAVSGASAYPYSAASANGLGVNALVAPLSETLLTAGAAPANGLGVNALVAPLSETLLTAGAAPAAVTDDGAAASGGGGAVVVPASAPAAVVPAVAPVASTSVSGTRSASVVDPAPSAPATASEPDRARGLSKSSSAGAASGPPPLRAASVVVAPAVATAAGGGGGGGGGGEPAIAPLPAERVGILWKRGEGTSSAHRKRHFVVSSAPPHFTCVCTPLVPLRFRSILSC